LIPINITNFIYSPHKKVTYFRLYKSFQHIVLVRIKLKFLFFLGGGRGSNPGPCIFYALSIPIELSSR